MLNDILMVTSSPVMHSAIFLKIAGLDPFFEGKMAGAVSWLVAFL
jgi:hypothetical protein